MLQRIASIRLCVLTDKSPRAGSSLRLAPAQGCIAPSTQGAVKAPTQRFAVRERVLATRTTRFLETLPAGLRTGVKRVAAECSTTTGGLKTSTILPV